MTERLIYLVDRGNDMTYGWPDVLLQALPYIPEPFRFRIADYAEFVRASRVPVVLRRRRGFGPAPEARWVFAEIGSDLGGGQIYLVKANENAAQ